jgi:hypothetical protein
MTAPAVDELRLLPADGPLRTWTGTARRRLAMPAISSMPSSGRG